MPQLVVLENETAAPGRRPESLDSVRQAAFELSGVRRLRLDALEASNDTGTYLARQVARSPGDLCSHVQRINLFLQQGAGDEIYSALLDLFIALGPKGLPLRWRMLGTARHALSLEQFQALREGLEPGIQAADAMPVGAGSMLSKGLTGSNRLVVNQTDTAEQQRDPLIEAREYLEYGQLEEARELLEQAVLKEPQRRDLQLELLEIYNYTRDETSFAAMRTRLEAMDVPLDDTWRDPASL